MGRGVWSLWGRRNDRRGWSLEIGFFVVCHVVQRYDDGGKPTVWEATYRQAHLGEHPTREAAMRRCEESMHQDVKLFMEEWQRYLASKAPQKHGGP
jgi:hypothetical protein